MYKDGHLLAHHAEPLRQAPRTGLGGLDTSGCMCTGSLLVGVPVPPAWRAVGCVARKGLSLRALSFRRRACCGVFSRLPALSMVCPHCHNAVCAAI